MPQAVLPFAEALTGRYQVERELGRGGMATVYLARDLRHERPVALKVLRPELGTVLAGERFAREIAVAARLTHPHILPLLDSGVVEVPGARPLLYYTMPYVEGRTLRDRLRAEPQLPLAEAATLARQVAEALDYANAQGVIHRDVKPENILLAEGAAVVADFGIARALDVAGGEKLTETGLALGTPAYMSPEQASGRERVDGRTDQYALACVVYELIAGQPPFSGPTPQAVLARHAVDPVPPLRSVRPTVPRAVERVLERALAKVPADRYTSTGEFARAFERALAAPAEPPARPVRVFSRPLRTALMAAAGLGAAAAAAASLWPRAPAPSFEPGRVLVAPLEHDPTDSALSRLAGQLVSTLPDAIARENVGEPVPAARVRDLLAGARGTPGEIAGRLARETGAGLQLRGACSRLAAGGTTCQVDLLRMPAHTLRMSVSLTGDPAQSAFAAALSERMLVMLFLQQRYGDRATWRGEYLPPSLAAVRKFWEARDTGEWKDYEEVMRLDSAWVSAWALAAAHGALTARAISPAASESMLVRLSLRPNLLPGQREAVMYWLASLQGDSELAYEMARRRAVANPEEYDGAAAAFATATSRPNAVLAISEHSAKSLYSDSALRTDPGANHGSRAAALHHLGRYREELEYARTLRRRFPGLLTVQTRSMEAAALTALGEVDTLRRLLAEWNATPEGPGFAGTRSWLAGQELIAHGHEEAGRAVLEGTLPLYRRWRDSTGYAGWNEVCVLDWLGRLDEARRLAVAALPHVKDGADSVGYLGALGSVAARQGRRAEAAKYDRMLSSIDRRPFLGGAVLFFRAQIAASLGDREGAVRRLEEARSREGYGPYGMPSAYGSVHRWPDFASLRGYPPFEQFLRPRD